MPTLTGMRREHGRTAGRGTSYLQWRASREALPFYASLGLIGDPVRFGSPFFEIAFEQAIGETPSP